MIKIHKTQCTMGLLISCTGNLMHPIGVWTDSNLQHVVDDMISYFKYSKVPKEQLTTMDLTTVTMLNTTYKTSMYTNIQTCPSLNQISQYFNGKKIPTFTSRCNAQGPYPDYEKLTFFVSVISIGSNSESQIWEHHPHQHMLQFLRCLWIHPYWMIWK